MTETTDHKPKKLTLGGSKLSFNRPTSSISVNKSVVSSKSNTIVEVKKSKVYLSNSSSDRIDNLANRNSDTASEDFNKRLGVLKKAAQDAREREPELKFNSLSKIAEINQVKKDALENNTLISESVSEIFNDENVVENLEIKNKTEIAKNISPANLNYENEEALTQKKLNDSKVVPPKPKPEESKKLKKTDIFHMLDTDATEVPTKIRSLASIKRAREKEKRKAVSQKQDKVYREVIIPETITVAELSNRMTERGADVVKELLSLGVIATSSQLIDADTAEIIVTAFGHTAKRVQESDVENILINEEDSSESLTDRAPIVTVMGHVDHGKTSLLDALKSTDIASTEAGGITQHIGAYKVLLQSGKAITFIDTPGHEAFTEMRNRGAQVTDIVVLVVAADDGIKKQTIEAINHAKAADVPIIVAINKVDKPDVDINRVKNELLSHGLVPEDLGGDTIVVPVSALKRMNLTKLEEAILLVAEMKSLRANFKASASGTVIEARMDKGKGIIVTILVRRGTLKIGDLVVAGCSYGRVRRMINDKGINVHNASPSDPVEVHGLNEAPQAGDSFDVVQTDKQARDITEYRSRMSRQKKVSVTKRASIEDLFLKAAGNDKTKELPIIIKGDAQGSIEAISNSLLKLPNDEIKLRILHTAVGGVTESDVNLAKASRAIILGFNTRASAAASDIASKENTDIRYYSIIYNLIDDIKLVMGGMLAPIIREQYIGSVDIREIFNVTKSGKIAGCYVTKGIIKKGAGVRLLRDNIVIHEGKLKTLKRFKEEVKEVKDGFECGIAFENYEDIRIGDTLEVFELIEEKKKLE
ncbi:MAG: translation initiation factor IF-2 [Rickettsiaceae bacterium]|nr:MAG: translation initiation factor IF-2 [Rickettsiaceae bacterium]